MERQRIQDTAEGMIRAVLMKIFEYAGGGGEPQISNHGIQEGSRDNFAGSAVDGVDHIPPGLYEFEISCTKRADDREPFPSIVSRMPPLFNLDGS